MRRKKESKLFHIMLKEFAVFSVLSIILVTLISTAIIYFTLIGKEKFFKEPYSSNVDLFESGQYEKLDMEKKYGKGSKFYVFDEAFELIYQSPLSSPYEYLKEDTLLMPDELDFLTTTTIDRDEGDLFKIEFSNDEGILTTVVIVDEHREVIYSNKGLVGKLSEETLECLYGDNGDYEMLKKSFVVDGREHVAVFMFPLKNNESLWNELLMILGIVFIFILFAAILSLYLYLRRLNKKVVKPMALLEENMISFNVEDSQMPMEYKGPAEFELIFKRFYEMAGRLKEAQESNRKMIADISHDLKTPLSVIQLYARVLDDDNLPVDEKGDMPSRIVEKTEEMSELINLFSDYSRLFHSELKFEFTDCDIVRYSREYLMTKYNELETLGYQMEINLPDKAIECSIDESNFKRIFDNLIGNSIKYNSKGTGISFTIDESEDDVVITVGDNGVGIDQELRERVFEAFSIGDEARTTGSGTGLGMAIVKKIADLHGGKVRLLSDHETDLSVAVQIKVPKIKKS